MKRCMALIIFVALSLAAPGADGAGLKKVKIAVLDFTLQGQDFETEDMGAIVAQWFSTAFVKAGRFDVIERGMIDKILREQNVGMHASLDAITVTRIGKLLGAEVMVAGSVLKLGQVLEINARIIDVESASIKAAENVKSSVAVQPQGLVAQMSEKLIKYFPLQGYIVSKSEKRVAIDLGHYAGAKVGMAFIVYKEGEVIRHPETGEVLDVERIQTGRVVLRKVRAKLSDGEILKEDPPGAITYGQFVYRAAEKAEGPVEQAVKLPTPPVKVRLYVDTDPPAARIRILNMVPGYYPGIELDPGSYHVEVSAPGYRTHKEWVFAVAGENKRIRVSLVQRGASPESSASSRYTSSLPVDAQAGLPEVVRNHIRMLRSGSSRNIVKSSKAIVRLKPIHPAILDTAASVLLSGYRDNAAGWRYVDAMSWLCNVLGASQKGRYRRTLQTVAAGARSGKLKKYAGKNLKKLR